MILLALKVLLTEFVAEMGDKTQLMLVAMTSKFKLKDIVLGTAAAILVLNGLAVLAGGIVGTLIPDFIIKFIAAGAFLYFAASSLTGDDDEEEETSESRIQFAPLAVAATFFVAELGDKTQLTAITFGANEIAAGSASSRLLIGIVVWIACSVGLFAADILGMLAGYLLKSRMPEGILGVIAFGIFSVFGIVTFVRAMMLLTADAVMTGIAAAAVIIIFAVICFLRRHRATEE